MTESGRGSDDLREDLRVSFRSMASEVRIWVVAPNDDGNARVDEARSIIERVAATCTRFDPASALMQANGSGRRWTVLPRECFDAISAAYDAYRATDGLFDPRVLRVLTAYGYDTSLPFESRRLRLSEGSASPPARRGGRARTWKPKFDAEQLAVKVGPEPIDLGGIGKGLAVRWAASHLKGAGSSVLVEAGGDLMATGGGPDGDGWMVAVENPCGGSDPTAVLRLRDRGCATSSTRVRSWTSGDTEVHHLIDPRTRRSADVGLQSVTVVGPDPAIAEVWSKALFVVGRADIRAAADARDLAAVWVDNEGRVGVSRTMRPYISWQVSRVS